jgi:ABC-type polysaccharide/polyol phosphate transport system ATPase subunit
MSGHLIEVDSVWKSFRLYNERQRFLKAAVLRGRRARYEEFWALSDVSFTLDEGKTLGVVGSNGSGKSTLLKCLTEIIYPEKGHISVNGRLAALLELGAGFQPELSGRENIYLNGAILGLHKKELAKCFDNIVEFSELGRFIDTPVRNYSSGMVIRLGFAIAAHVNPEILIIDEVLSVGDQAFQKKCIEKVNAFKSEGKTILVVSHGLNLIEELCESAIWLDKGRLRAAGTSHEVISQYQSEKSSVTTPTPTGTARTGVVQVLNVTLEDEMGKSLEVMHHPQPVKLKIKYMVKELTQNLDAFVSISVLNGPCLWASTSSSDAVLPPSNIGLHEVVFEIPEIDLSAQVYSFSIALRSATNPVEYDRRDNFCLLEVVRPNRMLDGGLSLHGTWHIEN